jgi:hypothetical protein
MKNQAAFHHIDWDEVKEEIDLKELKDKLKSFADLNVSMKNISSKD